MGVSFERHARIAYRVTRDDGFNAGLRALMSRIRTCRPGYAVSSDRHGVGLTLRDGSFLPGPLVAENVLAPVQRAVSVLEQRLSLKDEWSRREGEDPSIVSCKRLPEQR